MTRFIVVLAILSLLLISAEAVYSSFPDNTIPTLAMRILGSNVSFKDISIELLCELSWLNFDAVNFAGYASNTNFQNLMSLCDSTGVYYSICPNEIMQYLKAWGDPGCKWYSVLSTHGYYVSNGWDGWSEIGPIDLNDIDSLYWGTDNASELWLQIKRSGTSIDPPAPVNVRIGWIRLEESAP